MDKSWFVGSEGELYGSFMTVFASMHFASFIVALRWIISKYQYVRHGWHINKHCSRAGFYIRCTLKDSYKSHYESIGLYLEVYMHFHANVHILTSNKQAVLWHGVLMFWRTGALFKRMLAYITLDVLLLSLSLSLYIYIYI